MRVKIGNTWYTSEEQPIMVELNDADMKNIIDMHDDDPTAHRYAEFADHDEMTVEQKRLWMDDEFKSVDYPKKEAPKRVKVSK